MKKKCFYDSVFVKRLADRRIPRAALKRSFSDQFQIEMADRFTNEDDLWLSKVYFSSLAAS